VDNIHHDVSQPKFVQVARDYCSPDSSEHSSTYLSGIEFRHQPWTRRPFASSEELLQSSLTNAKHQKNIEIDLLFRLAILKFITGELQNSSPTDLDCKEYIRKRGEY